MHKPAQTSQKKTCHSTVVVLILDPKQSFSTLINHLFQQAQYLMIFWLFLKSKFILTDQRFTAPQDIEKKYILQVLIAIFKKESQNDFEMPASLEQMKDFPR